MRKRYLVSCFLLFTYVMTAQDLPKVAYELYPTLQEMRGFAVGKWQNQLLIFGGRVQSDVPHLYQKHFPNLEIILLDLNQKRASAYNSGNLPGVLGEQMAASGLAYFQKDRWLYLAGGYGYNEESRSFVTFPYLTAIDLAATIPALLAGDDPVAHFYQICEERLAIFDGVLDYNGDEFFLINGKYAYQLQPFDERPFYHEEDRTGEGATFRLSGEGKSLKIRDFKNWQDLQELLDYYSTHLPPHAGKAVEKTLRRRTAQ